MCAWCWLWTFVWAWLWRCVPGFFHHDISGALLYTAVYIVGAVLAPLLLWLFSAILQSAIVRRRRPLDKNARDAWKPRIDFRMELSVLVLILFEAFVGLLSLHLQKDESAVQDASATILNDRMVQTVTELQKAGQAIRDQLELLKSEHEQQVKDRAKKPILSLVTGGRFNGVKGGGWHEPSGPVALEDFTEHPCGYQPIHPGRIFLGVQNRGEVKATNGHLTFVLPYGFQVKCSPMACSTQSQDIHITNPDTDVTVPFEVSPRDTTPITMEFSAGYEKDSLVLRQMKMKSDQTDEKTLESLTVLTCLSKPKP